MDKFQITMQIKNCEELIENYNREIRKNIKGTDELNELKGKISSEREKLYESVVARRKKANSIARQFPNVKIAMQYFEKMTETISGQNLKKAEQGLNDAEEKIQKKFLELTNENDNYDNLIKIQREKICRLKMKLAILEKSEEVGL